MRYYCMVPGCRKQAGFTIEAERVAPGQDALEGLPAWFHEGRWEVCARHGAEVAQGAMDDPEAVLMDYDAEHDPRLYA